MQGMEGRKLPFFFPLPSLVAACHWQWQPFLWNSLCWLNAKFWGGISMAGQLPKFSPPCRMRNRVGHTWREPVAELDFKVGRKARTQHQSTNAFAMECLVHCMYVGDNWSCIQGNYDGRGNCQFLPRPILWQPSCRCGQGRPAAGQRTLLAKLYDIIFSCPALWHNGDFLLFTAGTSSPARGRPWPCSNAAGWNFHMLLQQQIVIDMVRFLFVLFVFYLWSGNIKEFFLANNEDYWESSTFSI